MAQKETRKEMREETLKKEEELKLHSEAIAKLKKNKIQIDNSRNVKR